MSSTMIAYLVGMIFCTITGILMTVKVIKKNDLSVIGGIVTRIFFIYSGIAALSVNLNGSSRELLLARVAIALVFFSDIIMNAVFFLSSKYRTTIEYKRLEKTLDDLKFKYKVSFDSFPVGIYTLNEYGHIEYVNNSLLNLLGYTKAEMLDRNVLDFIYTDDKNNVINSMNSKFEKLTTFTNYEVRLVKRDGSILVVKVFSNLTVNGHATITGCVLTKVQCGE